MSDTIFATAYSALAALPFAMQLAVAAGAPLGRFTVGGRFPGRLPGIWRVLALLQAALLAAMAAVVLSAAGLIDIALPGWTIWPVLGLTLLTTPGNLATPSRPERLLWGPVTVAMSLCLIGLIAL
ncbi:MAG: hypothetical protein KDK28_20475 [Maritimibacter sp.]|nr:hypothetical protein [Maritimibacter sp.]